MATFKRIVLVVLIIACVLGSSWVMTGINQVRDVVAIRTPVGPDAGRPEITILTHVLGGFKGLLVDAVWLRAVKLQQSNKFWELYQLYDWMGKLEPHLEEIWDFNGWNMSYNLVAELDDSEARWQWIQRSIEWLRDQGLRYNPRSGKIMERIAWIYFHKVGRDLDLHHYYYKHRFALIMHSILLDRDKQDFEKLSKAPETLAEFLKDPDVAAALGRYKLDPPEPIVASIDTVGNLMQIPEPIARAFAGKGAATLDKLRFYIGSRVLRKVYKMEEFKLRGLDNRDIVFGPFAIALDMEKSYGKFDWRLPEPHAIYWATRALMTDPNLKRQIDYDRLLMFSLQESMRRGLIGFLGPDPKEPMVTTFDMSKFDAVDRMYKAQMAKYKPDDRGFESIRDGHIHFLQEATRTLYFAGYTAEARKYFDQLRDSYDKAKDANGETVPTMEVYVLGQIQKLVDEFGTQSKVREFVDGCIFQMCYFLCVNKVDHAREYEQLARRAWVAYLTYSEAQAQGRVKHPTSGIVTYDQIQRDVIRNILLGRAGFPPYMLPRLRDILGIPRDADVSEKIEVKELKVPEIPPSSPAPK